MEAKFQAPDSFGVLVFALPSVPGPSIYPPPRNIAIRLECSSRSEVFRFRRRESTRAVARAERRAVQRRRKQRHLIPIQRCRGPMRTTFIEVIQTHSAPAAVLHREIALYARGWINRQAPYRGLGSVWKVLFLGNWIFQTANFFNLDDYGVAGLHPDRGIAGEAHALRRASENDRAGS